LLAAPPFIVLLFDAPAEIMLACWAGAELGNNPFDCAPGSAATGTP
jgi:hypothetical protein